MQVHQPIQKRTKALGKLKYREDVVITNSDKAGVVVLFDVRDYIKESERRLKHDPTTENNATVNKIITRFKNDKLVSSNVSDGLNLL